MADYSEIDKQINILASSYSNLNLPKDKIIEVDLGCGKGSFTSQLAKSYPDRLILAVDVMIGRLRKLTKRNNRLEINNIIPIKAEAWQFVCRCLPDNSIDRLHILCPDPWPKDRHKGHRLISSEFVYRMSLKLKKNGILHFATDDKIYNSAVVKTLNNCNCFTRKQENIVDIQHIKSDFECRWNEMGLTVEHSCWQKTALS